MADKKISQLTAASLPLAGTEVLPIVQSSATVKVSSNDLTVKNVRSNATTGILQIAGPAAAATRTMTVPDANFTAARTDAANSFTADQTLSTGNLIQGTAAKGVNFTANTPAAGMTSQLLNWYEEGTWTPSLGGTATYNGRQGFYTRIGRTIFITLDIDVNTIGTGATSRITNLPFTPGCNTSGSVGFFTNAANNVVWGGTYVVGSDASLYFTGNTASGAASSTWNIFGNGTRVIASISYIV
jgi:hypothetical protein